MTDIIEKLNRASEKMYIDTKSPKPGGKIMIPPRSLFDETVSEILQLRSDVATLKESLMTASLVLASYNKLIKNAKSDEILKEMMNFYKNKINDKISATKSAKGAK